MKSIGEVWRQRLWVWVPALLFFLLNAGAFSVYRLGYADRVQSLEANLENRREELQKLTADAKVEETLLNRIRTNQEDLTRLYDLFSTRSRRLISVSAEVKSLARRAGLNPRTFSYGEEAVEQYGLIKRSFSFSVEGTYVELRQFINLLELSSSFLTLEDATLAESSDEQGPDLRMNLVLSTLFTRETGDVQQSAALLLPEEPGTPETPEDRKP
jgi:Tfp pilus assembly protein PilO